MAQQAAEKATHKQAPNSNWYASGSTKAPETWTPTADELCDVAGSLRKLAGDLDVLGLQKGVRKKIDELRGKRVDGRRESYRKPPSQQAIIRRLGRWYVWLASHDEDETELADTVSRLIEVLSKLGGNSNEVSTMKCAEKLPKLADYLDAAADRIGGGKQAAQNDGGESKADSAAGMLSYKALAEKYVVDADKLRKRLDRWRPKHSTGYVYVENPRPREPRILYDEASVMPVIDSLKKGQQTGNEKKSDGKILA